MTIQMLVDKRKCPNCRKISKELDIKIYNVYNEPDNTNYLECPKCHSMSDRSIWEIKA